MAENTPVRKKTPIPTQLVRLKPGFTDCVLMMCFGPPGLVGASYLQLKCLVCFKHPVNLLQFVECVGGGCLTTLTEYLGGCVCVMLTAN